MLGGHVVSRPQDQREAQPGPGADSAELLTAEDPCLRWGYLAICCDFSVSPQLFSSLLAHVPVWKVGKPSRFSEASLSLTVQCGSCAANTRSTGVDGEEQQGPTSEGWCPHCGQRGQKAQTALWLDMAMSLDCITCERRGSTTQAASDLVFFSSALLLSLTPPSRWKI